MKSALAIETAQSQLQRRWLTHGFDRLEVAWWPLLPTPSQLPER